MTFSPQVDRRLQRTEMLWKRQFLIRQLAMLGAVTLSVFLAIGIAMHFGWFEGFFWPLMLIAMVMLSGLLGSIIIAIWTADKRADPEFLASTVEKTQQPLQDRLNTLVHLQHQTDNVAKVIRPAIEQQTVEVLQQAPETFPFSWRQNAGRLAVLGVLFLSTAFFYGYFQPWRQLKSEPPELEAELEIPATDSAIAKDEPNPLDAEAWTEVRISEPGRDLHVTQYEVVPLKIEAASNRHLERVEWFSEVNGQSRQQHAIPAPQDPRYVVHEAELLLEDLLLEPWDVLAYFARATTADGQPHDSEMYFIDLLPRREQLDELPGGEEGHAYQSMRELTDMIQRQQEVLRQTQHVSRPDNRSLSDGQVRHLEALAQEELQLREDIEYLEAMLRSRLPSTALEGLEQPTSQANEELVAAEQRLRDRSPADAVPQVRGGLANLIAMRKQIQQLLQDRPELFRPQPLELALADLAQQTEQMQASEAQLQQARQFVQETLLAQRDIERAANRRNQPQNQDLVQQQQELQQSLEDHIQDNPTPFQSLSGQCDKVKSAMRDAAQSLPSRREVARAGARAAARSLQQLDDALERQQQRNRLADAERLKQAIDQQVQQLKQLESQPQPPTPSECRNAGGQCKSMTDQLRQLSNRPGTAGSLGKRLQAALSDETKQQIDAESDALAQAKTNAESQSAAKQLRHSMEEVSRKLGTGSASGGQKSNQGLTPGGQQAVEQGLRQLGSLARRQSQQRLSAEARSQLSNEALQAFSEGITGLYGHNERTQLVLRQLREELEQPVTVDAETVRELAGRVEALRREAITQETANADQQPMTGIDPTRLPPEYRESIRKYFQELSRQP